MNTTTFFDRHHFLKSMVVVLAFLLSTQIVWGQAKRPVIPDAQTEAKALFDSFQILNEYMKLFDTLDAKSKVSRAEFERLEIVAGRVKKSVPSMKRNLQIVVQKAKTAGVWGQLDGILGQELQRLDASPSAKAKFLNYVKQHGGAREVMEQGLEDLSQVPASVTQEVQSISRKRISFPFPPIQSAYAGWAPWKCAVAGAVGIVSILSDCLPCATAVVIAMLANC